MVKVFMTLQKYSTNDVVISDYLTKYQCKMNNKIHTGKRTTDT